MFITEDLEYFLLTHRKRFTNILLERTSHYMESKFDPKSTSNVIYFKNEEITKDITDRFVNFDEWIRIKNTLKIFINKVTKEVSMNEKDTVNFYADFTIDTNSETMEVLDYRYDERFFDKREGISLEKFHLKDFSITYEEGVFTVKNMPVYSKYNEQVFYSFDIPSDI